MTIQNRTEIFAFNFFPWALGLIGLSFLAAACGVKGPPLPPLGKTYVNPGPSSSPKAP
jgi:hypothetical protein